ncbi:hypothetical protein [Streptomyces deccanensis]|uniref:hypothetical protein n=1 Tax=Streptomyces deccanensis TaxID=424188 RepID=UPI001EFAFA1A|nr:hypothetical protein [Streptomyces deccanensis]ULR55465.1 hypothetical protein L3078_42730 [Streptomyces deccanensis]
MAAVPEVGGPAGLPTQPVVEFVDDLRGGVFLREDDERTPAAPAVAALGGADTGAPRPTGSFAVGR